MADTVGRQHWSSKHRSVPRLLQLQLSLRLSEASKRRRSRSLFRTLPSQGHVCVVTSLQTRPRQSLSVVSRFLGLWANSLSSSKYCCCCCCCCCVLPHSPVNSRRQISSSMRKDVLVKSFPAFSITRFAVPVRNSRGIIENISASHFFGFFPASNKLIVLKQCLFSPVWALIFLIISLQATHENLTQI